MSFRVFKSSDSQLFPKSALIFGARITAAITMLAVQVVLARTVAGPDLGVYFFAASFASMLGVLSAVGYPNIANRFLAQYRVEDRPSNALAFLASAGCTVLIASFTTAALTIAVAGVLADKTTFLAIMVAMISVPMMAMSMLFGSVLNAEKNFLWASLPEFLLRPFFLLAAVLSFLVLDLAPSVLALLSTLFATYAVITFVQWRRIKILFPEIWPLKVSTHREARCWRSAAAPLITMSLFTNLFADLAIVLSGLLLEPGELALLAVALKLSVIAGFLIQAIHQMVLPDLTDRIARSDAGAVQNHLAQARKLALPISLTATLGVVVLGPSILSIFGPSYVSAYIALIVFFASQSVRALLGPCMQVLVAAGRQKQVMLITVYSVLVLVLASIIGSSFGGTGAAIGLSFGYCFWCLAGWIKARDLMGTSRSSSTPSSRQARVLARLVN